TDSRCLVLVDDDSARAVMRVLHLDERRRRIQHVIALFDRLDEFAGRETPGTADLRELHTRVRAAAAHLVPYRVALAADDDVVAGTRERAQRDLVRHGAGWQPERRLLTQQPCDTSLELVDGGVFTELIVADWRGGHCGPHAVGRTCNRVGAEIDHWGDAGLNTASPGGAAWLAKNTIMSERGTTAPATTIPPTRLRDPVPCSCSRQSFGCNRASCGE